MVPSECKNKIIELINLGFKPYQIAEKLHLNKTSTSCYIKKLGYNFSNTYNIKYPDYFEDINNYMKAYWLGFLSADGYLVNNPSKVVGITLSIVDKIVLENFKKYIGSEKPLYEIKPRTINSNNKIYTSEKQIRFTIGNSQMFDDLVQLGVTPNKSITLTNILDNIPYEYRDSFIVGYFDGDGSVNLPKGKIKKSNGIYYPSHSTTISIRGTKELLSGIKEHLHINTKLVYHKTFILNIFNKKDIIRFIVCYNNLNFFLERKYSKLISRMNHSSYNELIQAQTISSPYPYKEN